VLLSELMQQRQRCVRMQDNPLEKWKHEADGQRLMEIEKQWLMN
jgi:hypothetical protein